MSEKLPKLAAWTLPAHFKCPLMEVGDPENDSNNSGPCEGGRFRRELGGCNVAASTMLKLILRDSRLGLVEPIDITGSGLVSERRGHEIDYVAASTKMA